jgi:hypoxanthine phosphoribosyltransferase
MSELDAIPAVHRGDIESVLIPAADIDAKVAELGAQVSADYAGREVLLVGVLRGALLVMADLMRNLEVPCSIDFMAVSSYGAATSSSGVVRILKDLDTDIEGRDVIIVEDIVDSGLTLDYLVKNLRSRRPASLEVLTLLTKPSRREVDLPVRYVGFEVPDVFVVGYGLDFAERYRNLPCIATLSPEVYGAA